MNHSKFVSFLHGISGKTEHMYNSVRNKLNLYLYKQAGTGPSRRHIQGSKIPKGLQNVKVLVNWGPFYGKFFFEKKSHNAGKN